MFNLSLSEININNLKHNCMVIKEVIGQNCKLGIVVKESAYGYQLIEFLKNIEDFEEVSMVMVGKIKECRLIVENNMDMPILLLLNANASYLKGLLKSNITFSAYNKEFIVDLNNISKLRSIKSKVHIRIDLNSTGMGIKPIEFYRLYQDAKKLTNVEITGIYSHINPTCRENNCAIETAINEFDKLINMIPVNERKKLTIHIADSSLIFDFNKSHYNMVRAGIELYGLPYSSKGYTGLMSVMSLKARIISIEKIIDESTVSYYNKCNENKTIAYVALGYRDAPFLMKLKNLKVMVNETLVNVYGEPCMETCTIDITNMKDISIGDVVTFIGIENGVRITDIMKRDNIKITDYERLCMISKTVEKAYIKE